jgi:1-acyl-sn-glycerol-3-phosphate acyltransferase
MWFPPIDKPSPSPVITQTSSSGFASLIPVAIAGMREVLPIGRYVPRLFKRISVSCGPPVDYADLLAMPRTRETAQAVIDRVMDAIRVQCAELRRRRTEGGNPTS